MTEKDMTVKANTALSNTTQKRGLEEGVDKNDLIFPRAKLMQAMSPEVQESGMEQGKIINNLTLEECPESFVPVFKFTNIIKFNPRKTSDPLFDAEYEPGAVIWNITDPHDERAKEAEFGEKGEIPTAVKFMNYMVVFEGEQTPCIVSFAKTSYKAGKTLLSLLSLGGGKDIFEKKFKLIAKRVKGDEGYYYIYDIKLAGKATDEEFMLAELYWKDFAHRKAEIDVTANDDEDKPVVDEKPYEKGDEAKDGEQVDWNE